MSLHADDAEARDIYTAGFVKGKNTGANVRKIPATGRGDPTNRGIPRPVFRGHFLPFVLGGGSPKTEDAHKDAAKDYAAFISSYAKKDADRLNTRYPIYGNATPSDVVAAIRTAIKAGNVKSRSSAAPAQPKAASRSGRKPIKREANPLLSGRSRSRSPSRRRPSVASAASDERKSRSPSRSPSPVRRRPSAVDTRQPARQQQQTPPAPRRRRGSGSGSGATFSAATSSRGGSQRGSQRGSQSGLGARSPLSSRQATPEFDLSDIDVDDVVSDGDYEDVEA